MKAVLTVFLAAAIVVGAHSLFPATAHADDDTETETAVPATAARLAELLAAYDVAGGGNTIPIEQEILRLRDTGAAAALLHFAHHARFGPTMVWALGSLDTSGQGARIVAAADTWPWKERLHSAVLVAAIPAPEVRKWLDELAADEGLDDAGRRSIRLARLRAGVDAQVVALRADLGSDDPPKVADALLLAGDARAVTFLDRAKELVADGRTLAKPRASAFPVKKREDLGGGRVQTTTTYPELATLGDVALEAANRMVAPTTPEYIAWWYEMETGPRFGTGDAGHARLAAWLAARDAAAAAHGPAPERAVAALLRSLRAAAGDDPPKFTFEGVAWTDAGCSVTYRLDGGEPQVSRVAPDLAVTPEGD